MAQDKLSQTHISGRNDLLPTNSQLCCESQPFDFVTCRGFTWRTQSHTVKSDAWLKLLKRRRRWSAEHCAKIFTISTVNRGRDRRLDPSGNSRLRVTASRQSRWSLCKKGRTAATRYKINRPSLQDVADESIDAVFLHVCTFSANPARERRGRGRGRGWGSRLRYGQLPLAGRRLNFYLGVTDAPRDLTLPSVACCAMALHCLPDGRAVWVNLGDGWVLLHPSPASAKTLSGKQMASRVQKLTSISVRAKLIVPVVPTCVRLKTKCQTAF